MYRSNNAHGSELTQARIRRRP